MQLTFYEEMFVNSNGAIIDESEYYRYSLWRTWDDNLPRVTFIMLNPSTADSRSDDPTLRRCINFAIKWGFGSLEVVNLFGYRSTNPKLLSNVEDPIGKKNNEYILRALYRSEKAILAWGTKGNLLNRDKDVLNLIKDNNIPLYALEITKNGYPKHPLYVKSDIEPQRYL